MFPETGVVSMIGAPCFVLFLLQLMAGVLAVVTDQTLGPNAVWSAEGKNGGRGPRVGSQLEAEDGQLGSRVVEPTARDGAAGDLVGIAHHAQVVGLAVVIVAAAVPQAEEMPEFVHEGAG